MARPIAANGRRSGSRACAGPEARISSWPFSAGPLLPDTGASTNSASGRSLASCPAIRSVGSIPIVPICAHTACGANDSATRPSKMTDSTTAAVGSIVITTRASLTASAADGAACAPTAASVAMTPGDRSQTVVGSPAASSLRAIAAPMMPVPSTTTRPSPWLCVSDISRPSSSPFRARPAGPVTTGRGGPAHHRAFHQPQPEPIPGGRLLLLS